VQVKIIANFVTLVSTMICGGFSALTNCICATVNGSHCRKIESHGNLITDAVLTSIKQKFIFFYGIGFLFTFMFLFSYSFSLFLVMFLTCAEVVYICK
jgi:hypothetical protein